MPMSLIEGILLTVCLVACCSLQNAGASSLRHSSLERDLVAPQFRFAAESYTYEIHTEDDVDPYLSTDAMKCLETVIADELGKLVEEYAEDELNYKGSDIDGGRMKVANHTTEERIVILTQEEDGSRNFYVWTKGFMKGVGFSFGGGGTPPPPAATNAPQPPAATNGGTSPANEEAQPPSPAGGGSIASKEAAPQDETPTPATPSGAGGTSPANKEGQSPTPTPSPTAKPTPQPTAAPAQGGGVFFSFGGFWGRRLRELPQEDLVGEHEDIDIHPRELAKEAAADPEAAALKAKRKKRRRKKRRQQRRKWQATIQVEATCGIFCTADNKDAGGRARDLKARELAQDFESWMRGKLTRKIERKCSEAKDLITSSSFKID